MGLAVPDGAGPLGALLPGARTAAQEADRLGAPTRVQARRWLPSRELVVVGDSAFAALEFLAAVGRHRVTCATRLRLDAALYDPAAPRLPGTNGRPRTKGRRLATLSEILTNPATPWKRVTVPGWYGGGERDIEVSTDTAVWRHGGNAHRADPVGEAAKGSARVARGKAAEGIVRDPTGRFESQALLCTDLAQDPVQILRWFVQRWQVEVTCREVRDHLGVETQR